jgi:hypothetical protein
VSQDTNDAFSLLKAHASEVLVPALRSRNLKNQDMGAALLRAVLVPSSYVFPFPNPDTYV